jgi:indole-3-acetate monooxygenase
MGLPGTAQEARESELGRPTLLEIAKTFEPMLLAAENVIENERRIPQEITDGFYDSGIYRAFMPRELGGLEAHPIEWLDCVEEVSRINGSVGWLCMLHTGATWAKPEVMKPILEKERWITAGNLGRAGGKAYKVPGGYRVSGRWPFSSGSPDATYLFGRSVLYTDDDQPVTHPRDGLPWYLTGYFPRSEVTLIDTWDGMGLRGTGSGDIEVKDVFIPAELMNEMGVWERPYDRPLYRVLFTVMAHSAHALGLARAGIDEFTKLAAQAARRGSTRQARLGRKQAHQIAVAKADAMLKAARLLVWDTVEKAWADAQENPIIDYELRIMMHEANVYAVRTAREALDMIFTQAGSPTIFRGQRLERIHRDMITAAQHTFIAEGTLEHSGQYWLTKDLPGGPELQDLEMSFIQGPHPQHGAY